MAEIITKSWACDLCEQPEDKKPQYGYYPMCTIVMSAMDEWAGDSITAKDICRDCNTFLQDIFKTVGKRRGINRENRTSK